RRHSSVDLEDSSDELEDEHCSARSDKDLYVPITSLPRRSPRIRSRSVTPSTSYAAKNVG
ncbi:11789_t:CDS:2, partial [Dentiscutata erythropus]